MSTNPKKHKALNQTEYTAAVQSAWQQAAAPIVEKDFCGMNDMPLAAYLAYRAANNGNDPPLTTPFIRNWVLWKGKID
jgi:hypothetical protein